MFLKSEKNRFRGRLRISRPRNNIVKILYKCLFSSFNWKKTLKIVTISESLLKYMRIGYIVQVENDSWVFGVIEYKKYAFQA